jgi:hypothetical protein
MPPRTVRAHEDQRAAHHELRQAKLDKEAGDAGIAASNDRGNSYFLL